MLSNIRTWLAALVVLGVGAGGTAAAVAQAAEPEIELVTQPARSFERAIETHKVEARYHQIRSEARKLDAAAGPDLLARDDVSLDELRDGIEATQKRAERARKQRAKRRRQESFALAGGVSQATLDSIAACESGGDPTAVNAAGYYGKYQFDMGTWASVGGSGNPAEAPEAEQDYRASLLYSRAGASPWPVCGA